MFLVPPKMNESGEWGEIIGDQMNMKTETEMKSLYEQAVKREIEDG